MPIQKEVTASLPKEGKTATIIVNYASTLEEALEMFGEEAVLSNAFSNWAVTLQANIRRKLKLNETETQIQDEVGKAKMGVSTVGARADVMTAFMAKFKGMSAEEQIAAIMKLREEAKEA